MKFVKTEELKIGMRLARPIYSKNGVLLYDRNSNLTSQGIDSVKNFGLLGIYILEPAEPLPPMSDEDREFERFQSMAVSSIQDELTTIKTSGKQSKMLQIVSMIQKQFGHLNTKINFYQNLRSKDDFVFRHCLNVASLCAMIGHVMNLRLEEQQQNIYAAIVHDIGKLDLEGDLPYSTELSDEEKMRIFSAQIKSGDLMQEALHDGVAIKRICTQAVMAQKDAEKDEPTHRNMKMVNGAKVLIVANRYDELTGMSLDGNTASEVAALKELFSNPELYDPKIVSALVTSINILVPGVSVELNTGEKALVLTENLEDFLRPVVLSFRDNSIVDLSLRDNSYLEVVDIMKTLDNRCIIDTDALRKAGF